MYRFSALLFNRDCRNFSHILNSCYRSKLFSHLYFSDILVDEEESIYGGSQKSFASSSASKSVEVADQPITTGSDVSGVGKKVMLGYHFDLLNLVQSTTGLAKKTLPVVACSKTPI